jgi:hypothetical protein
VLLVKPPALVRMAKAVTPIIEPLKWLCQGLGRGCENASAETIYVTIALCSLPPTGAPHATEGRWSDGDDIEDILVTIQLHLLVSSIHCCWRSFMACSFEWLCKAGCSMWMGVPVMRAAVPSHQCAQPGPSCNPPCPKRLMCTVVGGCP